MKILSKTISLSCTYFIYFVNNDSLHFVHFKISYGDVMGKTLVFAVYDYDRFSKADAIGELRLPVCQLDLASSKDNWKDLQSIQGDGVVSKINIVSNQLRIYKERTFYCNFKIIIFAKYLTIIIISIHYQHNYRQ